MTHLTKNMMKTAGVLIAAALAGCSTTTATIDNGDKLAAVANGTDSVVFGKFTLVRNGEEAAIDDGLFAQTTAFLHVVGEAGENGIVGRVGQDGEFAWALEPGNYQISTIGFDNRGDTEEIDAGLVFTVPDGGKPVYIGTITLEASMDMGYHRTKGTVEDFYVRNDCSDDCGRRLGALGLPGNDMLVVMPQSQYQLARTN